jgi:hypothetical protein
MIFVPVELRFELDFTLNLKFEATFNSQPIEPSPPHISILKLI